MTQAHYEAVWRAKEDVGGGLFRVVLEPPQAVTGSYMRPGQYVVLRAGGKEAYFVLAGDIGETTWDLILRPGGEVATAAMHTSLGACVEVSKAHGTGFPIEEAHGRGLLVVVTGSGIAAARPVLRARVRGGEAHATELVLGVRTLAEVPLRGELGDWAGAGARITVCLSREPAPAGRDGFATGYVQDVVRAHATESPSAGKMIFAAGVRDMISAVRTLAGDLGVEESDVRTNY
jgi:NAD(P)H-flavin reductase